MEDTNQSSAPAQDQNANNAPQTATSSSTPEQQPQDSTPQDPAVTSTPVHNLADDVPDAVAGADAAVTPLSDVVSTTVETTVAAPAPSPAPAPSTPPAPAPVAAPAPAPVVATPVAPNPPTPPAPKVAALTPGTVSTASTAAAKPPAPAPAPVATPKPPAPAPAVKETAKPAATTTAGAAVTWPEVTGIADVDRLIKDVPPEYQTNIRRLKDYMRDMAARRPVSVQEGVKNQNMLYRTLQNTINKQGEYFQPLFTAVLRLFVEGKDGAFHESNVFRFMDNIDLPEQDRKAFMRLINLIKVLAPVAGRAQALKQVSFETSLRYGLTEEGRQRVISYFSVS